MATSSQYGVFVTTNLIWDVQQIYELDVNSKEFKELLVRLYQNINNMALVLNSKSGGVFNNSFSTVNGNTWFANPANNSSTQANPALRQEQQIVVMFGALPNTTTKSVPHGITCTATTTFTQIYATASDTTGFNYIPVTFGSPTLVNDIEITIDGTNVNITTGSNRSNFNICYVVLKYLQT